MDTNNNNKKNFFCHYRKKKSLVLPQLPPFIYINNNFVWILKYKKNSFFCTTNTYIRLIEYICGDINNTRVRVEVPVCVCVHMNELMEISMN